MGWWKNDAGETVGDDTAHAVTRDLRELNTALGRKLTLAELLGFVQLVLDAKSRDLLAAEASVSRLAADVVIFGSDDPLDTTIEMAKTEDLSTRQRIDRMCADISELYEAFCDRRPTLGEMLESIRFPLDAELVDLPGDADVRAIRVVRSDGT